MASASYRVKNMTCSACANSVENMLKFTPGVTDAIVNYAADQVKVSFLENEVDFQKMKSQVQAIGYDLEEIGSIHDLHKERALSLRKSYKKFSVALIFSIPVFLIAMFIPPFKGDVYLQLLLSLPVIFYSGRDYYINAYKRIKHFQFNMDTLIAMGTGTAFIYSLINTFFPNWSTSAGIEAHVYYESAVVIITLILLGKTIEEKAKAGTNKAIESLMDLQPQTALRVSNGESEEVSINDLQAGDLVQIFPGQKVPIDGKVFKGPSFIDESMLTGEPEAIEKQKGDQVNAGTINQNGSLMVETEKTGSATLLAQIIELVQEAQGSKAPAQKLADKISSIFVPTVLSLALITFSIWLFIGPGFTHAFSVLISVLIIACPCALGLATPTAITVGIGKAAKNGILIKDAEAMDHLKDIEVLALDKTGTITKGKPEVTLSHYHPDSDEVALKSIILSLETLSEHPLAKAVLSSFHSTDLPLLDVQSFQSVSGVGISGVINHKTYTLGKVTQLSHQEVWVEKAMRQAIDAHCTIMALQNNDKTLAILGLKDPLKPGIEPIISTLQKKGIEVCMLTGDHESVARHVAEEVGIKKVYADLLPKDKLDLIQSFQNKGQRVAMAGDGINDAAALASADVGLAMSTGTDIAMQSADITLINGDLKKIQIAINISRQTSRTIRQNLFWAFFYNIIAIPIAAGILYPINGFLLNPMIAGGAMAFSSITVVLNSLLLKARR